MNSTPSFETNNSTSASIPFDFNLHSTIISHLSSLSDHLHILSQIQSRVHPFSSDQPPVQDNVTSDLLTLSASLQNYHATLAQIVQPINEEPMVLGAERFIARLKEHAAFLSRLELRKRAIRQVKEEIEKCQVKQGGVRRDLRFTQKCIATLVKQFGYNFSFDGADELDF
jgi:hypothetical protein